MRDEDRLRELASAHLPTIALIDRLIDAAGPIAKASAWSGLPVDALPRTAERYTAANAVLTMGLRSARAVQLLIASGYGREALSSVRRLLEVSGHAARIAEDSSGQYAANWLEGRGRADRPRSAFGPEQEHDVLWKLMSGQAHATFEIYARMGTRPEGERLMHMLNPARDEMDDLWLILVGRHLSRVIASVLRVRPEIEQADFLGAAAALVQAEEEAAVAIEGRLREPGNGSPSE